MMTKLCGLACAALLVMGAAGCGRSPVHPDASLQGVMPALDEGIPPDVTGDTGYFGSGHYEPVPPPPPDTTLVTN